MYCLPAGVASSVRHVAFTKFRVSNIGSLLTIDFSFIGIVRTLFGLLLEHLEFLLLL